jgi:hypothetical protein
VERNVVITEEMANEMSTHITYLGTKLTARNQQEAPAFCDRSREGFAEILLGLPEYLPQALVGGCRKAWKAFAKVFVSQSEEESENDKAVLTNDSPDAPLHLNAVGFYDNHQEHPEDDKDNSRVVLPILLMGRLGSPTIRTHGGKVLTFNAHQVSYSNKESVANPCGEVRQAQKEVIFRSQRKEVIFTREKDQGPAPERQQMEIVGTRPTGLVTSAVDEAMEDDDSDSHTMDSHTMDFPIDSRIVHRGPPPGKQQTKIVWSSSDSGRSSHRSAGGRGRTPGTGTPNTVRRRKRRETSGGDQVEPAENTARSGGPRAHLLVETLLTGARRTSTTVEKVDR